MRWATPRVKTLVEAAGVATIAGIAAAGLWEIGEWVGMKLGAKGMDLTYDDTITDLAETAAGALLGGVVIAAAPSRLRKVPGRPTDPVVKLSNGSESRSRRKVKRFRSLKRLTSWDTEVTL